MYFHYSGLCISDRFIVDGAGMGVNGIAGAMCLSLLISSVALPIQYKYIINGKKSNFWNA